VGVLFRLVSGLKRLLVLLQLAWAYVFLSGLSGAALTYYYDDEGNVKLLNILKYGLMLLGLGLVFCSTSMTEASATLCVLLLGSLPASVIWDKRYSDICPCPAYTVQLQCHTMHDL